MEDDYKQRIDTNKRFVQTLRSEGDEQKSIHDERRHINCNFNIELDRQRSLAQDRNQEISKLKIDVYTAIDGNHNLQAQKRRCEEEIAALRDRNRDDL